MMENLTKKMQSGNFNPENGTGNAQLDQMMNLMKSQMGNFMGPQAGNPKGKRQTKKK